MAFPVPDSFAQLPVSAPLLLLAAVAVVAGAPLFAAGRRALRLRRVATGLAESPLSADAAGVVAVRGRVALESPMFAPLSGKPCAGYTLEVAGDGMRVGMQVGEMRSFRLVGEQAVARVVADGATWSGPVTSERAVGAAQALPERLNAMLEHSAEVRWLRDRRVPLRITERALFTDAEVFVTGVARSAGAARTGAQVYAMIDSVELAATGTDGAAWAAEAAPASSAVAHEPELWIEPGEPLEQVRVHAEWPASDGLTPPLWKVTLMLLGPALTLAGLLYLAQVAAPLIAGRF